MLECWPCKSHIQIFLSNLNTLPPKFRCKHLPYTKEWQTPTKIITIYTPRRLMSINTQSKLLEFQFECWKGMDRLHRLWLWHGARSKLECAHGGFGSWLMLMRFLREQRQSQHLLQFSGRICQFSLRYTSLRSTVIKWLNHTVFSRVLSSPYPIISMCVS